MIGIILSLMISAAIIMYSYSIHFSYQVSSNREQWKSNRVMDGDQWTKKERDAEEDDCRYLLVKSQGVRGEGEGCER